MALGEVDYGIIRIVSALRWVENKMLAASWFAVGTDAIASMKEMSGKLC